MRQYIPQAEAARVLRISINSIRRLVAAGVIATNDEARARMTDVEQLAEQRANRPYIVGKYNISSTLHTIAFACPITSERAGHTLKVQDVSERKRLTALAKERNIELPEGSHFSGWWEIADRDTEQLVNQNGVLLGVLGGFVIEAARVHDMIERIAYRNRKAFVVVPMADDELDDWTGFVTGMQPTPRRVQRPEDH